MTQGGHTRLFAQVASNLHNDVIPGEAAEPNHPKGMMKKGGENE